MSDFVPPGPGQPPEEPGSPPQQPQQPWPPQYPGQPPYVAQTDSFRNRAEEATRAGTSRKMAGWGLGLSLLICVPFAPLVGLGLGIAALIRAQGGRVQGQEHGKGMAIAATVIGGLYVLVFIGFVVFGVVEGFREGFDDEPERDATTGEFTESGDLMPSKLRVGDCFDEPELDNLGPTGEFETELVAVVPCSDPHDAEVYHAVQLTGSEYPGQDAIDLKALACAKEFKEFVGVGFARSKLDGAYYFPSQETWDFFDDRSITCAIFDPVRGKVTGSFEGSRR